MGVLHSWTAGDKLYADDLNANFTSIDRRSQVSLLCGESISAGDSVAVGWYQSDGGILYDSKVSGSGSAASSALTTSSITVGSNSNRVLVAFIQSGGTNDDTSTVTATFNGVSMTKLDTESTASDSGAKSRGASFILFAPSTGSYGVVFAGITTSQSYSYTVHSYYNVTQSTYSHTGGSAQRSNAGSGTNLSVSTDLSAIDAGLVVGYDSSASTTFLNNTGSGGDSGLVIPAASYTISYTTTNGSAVIGLLVGLQPYTAPTAAVVKTTAANNNSSTHWATTKYKSNSFIGIANTAGSAGSNAYITIGGLARNLSSIKPLQQYYLADSAGTYSATAGTNSKKIGVGVTTTSIALSNQI